MNYKLRVNIFQQTFKHGLKYYFCKALPQKCLKNKLKTKLDLHVTSTTVLLESTNYLSKCMVNGQRTLLKESVPVQSVLLSQCLQNFTTFLSNDKTDCHTILIGHNSSVFDTPTLLRCAGPVVKELLSSNNVFFADSLPLVRALIKAGNPSLNPEGKACKTNLPAVFQTVFNEQFAAHDALEDVLALRRVLFQSSLKLAVADIVNNSNVKSTSFAYEDMQFLDERLERMQTFKNISSILKVTMGLLSKLQKAAYPIRIYSIYLPRLAKKHWSP